MKKPPPMSPKDISNPHNSKKLSVVSSGGGAVPSPPSSNLMNMELDVVEIAPPVSSRPSKLLKRKEFFLHEIIDVDEDEDSADIMMYGMKVEPRNKGKAVKKISNGYLKHQTKESYGNDSFVPGGVDTLGTVNGVDSSKGWAPGSHYSINVDGHNSDTYHDTDKYLDFYTNDVINVDEYEKLQAQFDKVDIPPGVEASLPWFPDLDQIKCKAPTGSSSNHRSQMQSECGFPLHEKDPYPSFWPSQSAQLKMKSASLDAVIIPPGMELPPPQFFPKAANGNNTLAASKPSWVALKDGFTENSFQSSPFFNPSFCPNSTSTSLNQVHTVNLPHAIEAPLLGHGFPSYLKKQRSGHVSYSSSQTAALNHPPGADAFSSSEAFHKYKNAFHKYKKTSFFSTDPSLYDPLDDLPISPEEEADNFWGQEFAGNHKKISGTVGSATDIESNSCSGKGRNLEDIMGKFKLFKQFDTVDDHSDHHYAHNGSSMKQPSKVWAKRIQEEWRILEKDLPDSIFVRVYESRMDLLRAVIKGAEGTPYHDGLFFFDVFFPSAYPNGPPLVHYHSGGVRLNPNLYACGKVCLSLLNTWSGNKNEKWIPGKSSMLQVLVSIQGLILNTKPYFNEPGFANMSGTPHGEKNSLKYNEDTFILSLRTMSFTMRRPPKHFEDLVVGHFCERAHDIMVACKAYVDGAQVGCLVKGGVQDVDEGDKSCSDSFRKNVAKYINVLATGFLKIGAKDCEKFLSPANTGSNCAGVKVSR